MAPRPIWTGTVSFALLSVPVKLYTATRSKDISFNQIEKSTGSRVKQKKVSSVTGDELAAEDIVKGYKLGGDSYVFVESEELDALAPRDAANERTIRIQEVHILVIHCICDAVDNQLLGEQESTG